jgi:S1-C subfamily serine protease
VLELTPGGPASRAGLQPGDLLLTADGEELAGVDALQRLLTAAAIDREIELRFLRGREILGRVVTPASRP